MAKSNDIAIPLNTVQAAEFLFVAGVTDRYDDLHLFRAVAEALGSSALDGFGSPGAQERVDQFRERLQQVAIRLGIDVPGVGEVSDGIPVAV